MLLKPGLKISHELTEFFVFWEGGKEKVEFSRGL